MIDLSGLSTRAVNRLQDFCKHTQPSGTELHIDMILEARNDTLLSVYQFGEGTLKEIDTWLSKHGLSRNKQKHFGKWHLIDTAPKDGLRRLLYLSFHGHEPVCGYWVWWKNHQGGYWWHDKLSAKNYKYSCAPHELPQPTHWMPLPDAPQGY